MAWIIQIIGHLKINLIFGFGRYLLLRSENTQNLKEATTTSTTAVSTVTRLHFPLTEDNAPPLTHTSRLPQFWLTEMMLYELMG